MATFDLNSILEKYGPTAGPDYGEHLNRRFYDLLRLTGFDRRFVRGEGAHLFDEAGEVYLDAIGGYASVALGREHPVILDALKQLLAAEVPPLIQWETSPLAVALAIELKRVLGREGDRVFFVNTGTEAVEGAIKFARAATNRTGLVCCSNGFHGLTLGSLSLTDGAWLRRGFGPFLPDVSTIPFGDLHALRAALAAGSVAAFIVEPIQGKGVILPPEGYLRDAADICRSYGTLFIADEIQTGLGRTGDMLASVHDGAQPDMVLVSKSLSAGIVPVGAIVARAGMIDQVFDSVDRSVAHSSTFREGPLAMTVALAALHIIESEGLVERSARVGADLKAKLESLAPEVPGIVEVRGRGLMLGVELDTAFLSRAIPGLGTLQKTLIAQAFIMRLLQEHRVLAQATSRRSAVIKLVPPLVIGDSDVIWIVDAFRETLQALGSGRMADLKGLVSMVKNAGDVVAREAIKTGSS